MSYNLDERLGDNHYNCPVVAYYPEVHGRQHRRPAERAIYLRLCRASTGARISPAR